MIVVPSTIHVRAAYPVPEYAILSVFRGLVRQLRAQAYHASWFISVLLVASCLLPTRAAAQDALADLNSWRQQKSYALLFATNDYDYWQRLTGPVPDARELKKVLEKEYGFQVELVENATREQILATLVDYEHRHFNAADQLLIFFAGHGFRDSESKQGYLVAKDTKSADDDPGRATFESYDDLRGKIDAIPVKHLLLVLDACFGGTFDAHLLQSSTRGEDSSSSSLAERFRDRMPYRSRKYVASGGDHYVPDTSASGHTPFVYAFLQALHDHDQRYFATPDLEAALQTVNPEPRAGNWGTNEAGGEFFFISRACLTSNCGNPGTLARATPSPPSQPMLLKVAVMGFKNLSGKPTDAWISDVLASQIATDIAAKGGLETVSAEGIVNAKAQLSLADTPGYAKDSLAKLNTLLGASYVVTGSYLVQNEAGSDHISVGVILQNAATGETVAAFPETGLVSTVTELSSRGGEALRNKLPISVADSIESEAVSADPASVNSDAIRYYRDGLNKLASYNLPGARDALQKAVKLEPDSAMIQEAMSRAWFELGFDQKARSAAETAYEISKRSASMETRFLMEANYRELNSQWDQAINVYKELWQAFPNDVDYGLELARVQTDGGKPKDALATLTTLKSQIPDAAQDPRVDLQQAVTASNLGDAIRQRDAALAAAEKAAKLGSRLFLAEAYWQQCDALTALGQLEEAKGVCEKANTEANFAAAQKVRARTLTVLANVMLKEGQLSGAMENQKQILEIARSIGSEKDIVGALLGLANSESRQGQLDEAETHRQEAIERATRIGDNDQLLKLQNDRAADLQVEGRYQDASTAFDQALHAAREIGDQYGTAMALNNLGSIELQLGRLPDSEKNIRESLAISQRARFESLHGSALLSLGDLQLAKAEIAEARASYDEARKRFEQIGEKNNIAASQLAIAKLLLEQSKPADAEALARAAAKEFANESDSDDEADARTTVARALVAENKLPEADEELAAAASLGPRDRLIQISLAVARAEAQHREGKTPAAVAELSAQLDNARKLALVGQELQIRLMLAELNQTADSKSAKAELQSVAADAEKAGYNRIATRARATLGLSAKN